MNPVKPRITDKIRKKCRKYFEIRWVIVSLGKLKKR